MPTRRTSRGAPADFFPARPAFLDWDEAETEIGPWEEFALVAFGLDASVKALAAFSAAAKSFFEDFKVALATNSFEGPIGYFISDFEDSGFKTAVLPAFGPDFEPAFKGENGGMAFLPFEGDGGTDGLFC